MNEKQKNRIVSWIEETMKEEGFSKMTIDLDANEVGEGFVGEVIFAKVTDQDDENKKADLVLKLSKDSANLRKIFPGIAETYKRELRVYNEIFPTFREFQSKKNVVNTFDSYPKCYKTFQTEDMEVLVFENLRETGYVLHNRRKPMNLQHLHLVLKNYAKFHALSLALRDQDPKKFSELTADYSTRMTGFLSGYEGKASERLVKNLEKGGKGGLVAKYEQEIKNIRGILDEVEPESVVIHGDCHNNNFLFQYKDGDEENPARVSIIDWQVSSLHSPAVDLAIFLYFGASAESLSKLDELLKFYHTHLKNFLKELGSDAEKLFPYSTLVKHWKRNSIFALYFSTNFLHMLYAKKEDAPAFEEAMGPADLKKMMARIRLEDEDVYRERLIAIIEHHCNFKLS